MQSILAMPVALTLGRSGDVGLIAWLSSSDGVAGHYSVAQALRVAYGLAAVGYFGVRHRGSCDSGIRVKGIPSSSAWLGVFVVVFGALAAGNPGSRKGICAAR